MSTSLEAQNKSRVCGMNGATGDLPWPLSFKLVPDAEEIEREKRTSFRLPPADSSASPHAEESKLCDAWFNYKGSKRQLQWVGPAGGERLISHITQTYRIPKGKLVFLVDTETMEVVDVDSPLVEGGEYKVHVEPEDSTPFNIMPCFLSLCTYRGFQRGQYLGE